jgi:parallel beta-helix repeat protein
MRRGGRRIRIVVGIPLAALVVAAALPAASVAKKRKVTVRPGNDAITKALERVKEPGVVRVKRGRYREQVTIDKQVKLRAVGKGRPVIDGECEAELTVAVRHDDVKLQGLKVVGAGAGTFPIEVDFRGVSGGGVRDLVMKDTCDEAEYGINLYDTGPIDVRDSRAVGFSDAGFYAGQISGTPGGAIRFRGNEAFHNTRGVIVENSAGGDIRVSDNVFNANDVPGFAGAAGIVIHNADGVLVERNEARNNLDFGLHLTPGSDGNTILSNTLLGNPIDIRNQGSGNCGTGNTSATGDTLAPC